MPPEPGTAAAARAVAASRCATTRSGGASEAASACISSKLGAPGPLQAVTTRIPSTATKGAHRRFAITASPLPARLPESQFAQRDGPQRQSDGALDLGEGLLVVRHRPGQRQGEVEPDSLGLQDATELVASDLVPLLGVRHGLARLGNQLIAVHDDEPAGVAQAEEQSVHGLE